MLDRRGVVRGLLCLPVITPICSLASNPPASFGYPMTFTIHIIRDDDGNFRIESITDWPTDAA
jgi:hypothetical protein